MSVTDEGRTRRGGDGGAFSADEIAAMIIAAREHVTRTAVRHPEFAGLGPDDVDELFDATAAVLVQRHDTYAGAAHVRSSLWVGMRLRAQDVFRRRTRRGGPEVALDPTTLVADDAEDEERIAREQDLLVVRDFLAALRPAEAEVWKLVVGEGLAVSAAASQLGCSRHAVAEHRDAATRKLELFVALREAGEWCGRREVDIERLARGVDEPGTVRRATAHLEACAVCRRMHAARVRRTGRIAAGVLPLPVVGAGGSRTLLERLVELLPVWGGGGGRTEAAAGVLLGGGLAGMGKAGVAIVGTATLAAGTGAAVVAGTSGGREPAPVRSAAAAPPARPTAPVVAPAGARTVRGATGAATRTATPVRDAGSRRAAPTGTGAAAGPGRVVGAGDAAGPGTVAAAPAPARSPQPGVVVAAPAASPPPAAAPAQPGSVVTPAPRPAGAPASASASADGGGEAFLP